MKVLPSFPWVLSFLLLALSTQFLSGPEATSRKTEVGYYHPNEVTGQTSGSEEAACCHPGMLPSSQCGSSCLGGAFPEALASAGFSTHSMALSPGERKQGIRIAPLLHPPQI